VLASVARALVGVRGRKGWHQECGQTRDDKQSASSDHDILPRAGLCCGEYNPIFAKFSSKREENIAA
jgi:hypothetical protein